MNVTLGDTSFTYDIFGPSSGVPIIFLHGFPLNRRMWNPQLPDLKDRYRLFLYDQRGHGQTRSDDLPYTFETLVDDFFALLDYWKIDKPVICGISMGGYVALRAYERDPERLGGLFLCDTRSEADSNEIKLKRAASLTLLKEKGVADFAEGFLKSAISPALFSGSLEKLQWIREMVLENDRHAVAATLVALASRTDTSATLSKIRIPAHIVVGEVDPLIPLSAAKALQDSIQGAGFTLIPNAAHFPNIENAEAFNTTLLKFLAQFPS